MAVEIVIARAILPRLNGVVLKRNEKRKKNDL